MAKRKPVDTVPSATLREHDAKIIQQQRDVIAFQTKEWEAKKLVEKLSDLVVWGGGAWPIHANRLRDCFEKQYDHNESALAQWFAFIAQLPEDLARSHERISNQLATILREIAVYFRQAGCPERWRTADTEGFFQRRFSVENPTSARLIYDPAVILVGEMMTTGVVDETALRDVLDSPRGSAILGWLHLLLAELWKWDALRPAPRAPVKTTAQATATKTGVILVDEQKTVAVKDGPEGGRWVGWAGKRHDIPAGVTYRLIEWMWNRDVASYDDLMEGKVWDGAVVPQTVRSRVSKVNVVLRKAGIPWRLRRSQRPSVQVPHIEAVRCLPGSVRVGNRGTFDHDDSGVVARLAEVEARNVHGWRR